VPSLLDKILAQHNEQAIMLNTLKLWEHAEVSGYTCTEVRAFTFRPDFLSISDRKELKRAIGDRGACTTHFNCVRLHDGCLRRIPLVPRPENLDAFKGFVIGAYLP
jgi:hypothetical protein